MIESRIELLSQGKIRQGYLGVGLQPVAVPEKLRAETGRAGLAGLMVLSVEPGTSAEEGGLELGDILVAAGETLLEDPETLQGVLRGDTVGKPMKFTVLRAGRAVEIELRIAARRGVIRVLIVAKSEAEAAELAELMAEDERIEVVSANPDVVLAAGLPEGSQDHSTLLWCS